MISNYAILFYLPSHYTNSTTHNLKLLSLLHEQVERQDAAGSTLNEILSDQIYLLDWPLASLE